MKQIRPQLHLRTSANLKQGGKHYVEIVIADDGHGIPNDMDVLERGVTSKDGNHAGQGLAVVGELTAQVGGYLGYRSSPDGTEFRITIPEQTNR